MPLKEKLKRNIKEEKAKLSNMSLKDKIWYIWAYYKMHMLGFLVLCLLIYIVTISIHNRNIDSLLYGAVINDYAASQEIGPLEEAFKLQYGFDPKKENITLDTTMFIDLEQQTEFTMSCITKITVLMASQSLDFILTDPLVYQNYAYLDSLMDMESFLPEEMKASLSDRFVYAADSEGNQKAYGLDLSGTHYTEVVNTTLEPPVFSVVSNTQNTDNVLLFLRILCGLQ